MSNDKVSLNPATSAPPTHTVRAREQGAAPAVAATERENQTQRVASPIAPSVEQVAARIESYLKGVNRSLEFKVDANSGRTVVTVRDAESGDLIRQIPNEEVLRFAQLAEEQTIVLLNEKV